MSSPAAASVGFALGITIAGVGPASNNGPNTTLGEERAYNAPIGWSVTQVRNVLRSRITLGEITTQSRVNPNIRLCEIPVRAIARNWYHLCKHAK